MADPSSFGPGPPQISWGEDPLPQPRTGMTSSAAGEVTQLLSALGDGDQSAAEALIPLVYDELRALASAYLRAEGDGHTLQPTALVHEAYLKLVNQHAGLNGASHFFAIAAQAMRRILIDHARRRNAQRRGGGRAVTLRDDHATTAEKPVDVLALDDALRKLAKEHTRQARTVELRYFGGLGVRETAQVLGVSEITVKRDWRYAKAWLSREVGTAS